MPLNELFGFFLVLVLNPILGFVTASMIQRSAEMFENFAEDKHKEDLEIARQKALEEERQRLAAERAAAENRLKLAFDNMEKLWEKALSVYGGCEGGELNDFGIAFTPSASLTDAIIYKRLKIEPPLVPMYLAVDAAFQENMPEPTQVWVTNEQRLKAIENILC